VTGIVRRKGSNLAGADRLLRWLGGEQIMLTQVRGYLIGRRYIAVIVQHAVGGREHPLRRDERTAARIRSDLEKDLPRVLAGRGFPAADDVRVGGGRVLGIERYKGR